MVTRNSSSTRISDDDQRLLDALKAATGMRSNSEITRMGWRALAEKLKVKVPPAPTAGRPRPGS